MYILKVGIIDRLFRNIFFLIDDAIYSQIPKLYDLLMSIARTSPLSQASIADMASRIYKLLAVFMMFKVILSLIMYVVNPDDFSDKSKGVSKLVTNIVISLALLVLTPYFFSYGYQLQKIILEDNALATIIFGDETDTNNTNIIDAGDQMAYLTMSAFVYPNTNVFYGCTNIVNEATDGSVILDKECFGFEDVNMFAPGGTDKFDKEQCEEGKNLCTESWKPADDGDNKSELTRADLANYAAGVQYQNYNLFFRKDLVTARVWVGGDPEYFAFKYVLIVSTIVGVIVALFLITSCMDIALRSIKLAFLQLIAPIPILSYIDPKSGKDGMFKKWYQMCLKTYLSLFLKLLALYFALYIINRVGRLVDIIDGSRVTNAYITIFIIIGALMFAKNFTKILESLGVKLDGGFQLNPFKKLENEALGMKKPAAFANKLAKGILTSPATGASLVGRKFIAGMDAAKHDKGFWNGVKSVPVSSKFAKKWDELHPYSAEAKKEAKKAKAEIKGMEALEEKGQQVYKAAGGKSDNLRFKNSKYKASFDEMNREKGAMYRAQANGEAEKEKVKEKLKNGLIQDADLERYGIEKDASIMNPDGKTINQELAATEMIKKINKDVGTAEKRYNIANKKHEQNKRIYTSDAALEDAFDYYDKTATQAEKDILLGKKPAEPVTEQNNQDQQRNEQYTVDNQNSNDQSSTTNSESTESPDIDTSTNNDSTSNSKFQPLYDSINRDIDAALKDLEQSVNNSGTPSGEKMYDGTAERRKKIDEEIEKLIAEYNSLGDSASDTIRKNEISRLIKELDRQR